jgi:hypothetical protein
VPSYPLRVSQKTSSRQLGEYGAKEGPKRYIQGWHRNRLSSKMVKQS